MDFSATHFDGLAKASRATGLRDKKGLRRYMKRGWLDEITILGSVCSIVFSWPCPAISQATPPIVGVRPLYVFRRNAEGSPKPLETYKIVFDLNTATPKLGALNPGLIVVAGLVNTYAEFGVEKHNRIFAVVLRGEFVELAVDDATYKQRHAGIPNPDLALIRQMDAAGVSFAIDAPSLAKRHIRENDVLPIVRVTAAADLMFLDLESSGYVYTSTRSLRQH
jgi:intracellular sulfur oxidation DsrE/DsrF family protein